MNNYFRFIYIIRNEKMIWTVNDMSKALQYEINKALNGGFGSRCGSLGCSMSPASMNFATYTKELDMKTKNYSVLAFGEYVPKKNGFKEVFKQALSLITLAKILKNEHSIDVGDFYLECSKDYMNERKLSELHLVHFIKDFSRELKRFEWELFYQDEIHARLNAYENNGIVDYEPLDGYVVPIEYIENNIKFID